MDKTPLVSVVVPVYNMEAFLPETLDSILASDYPNFEVVVVDDGSKDASYRIACDYAKKDQRVRAYTQPNGGACAARNQAVRLAKGEFILPVDADNLIEPGLIADSVKEILKDPSVKVVAPRADFFGERTGEWKLPPFSLHLLARKNIMDTCALYRKVEWERAGGYCESIIAREDWEFWIAVLKDGGKVVRLPEIGLHYRIRNVSKRVTDRSLKRHVVKTLNARHPEFFERELGGPLRYRRSWSVLLNRIYRLFHPRKVYVDAGFCTLTSYVKALPALFKYDSGTVIYKGRNELREMDWYGTKVVIKSFRVPNLINRIAYGVFRSSKAQRSFEYAEMLRREGIGSPAPVAYYTERNGLLFTRSYYVSLKSECPYSYVNLMRGDFPGQEEILRAIARTTAALHEKGYLHKDYSRGNILFRHTDKGVEVEIIDLNRIRFRTVNMEEGCRNFERLPGTPEMFAILADEYAKARGFDANECLKLILKYNNAQI
ncbi:glycosyltransferase [Phocaeicola coprocola]|uniref:glycosyltransferase n=1 Tax=Phocaeicola coprocola TaxID=310298 RepID=UPI00266FA590|nr:glycosyltransferase [Phocaeicola coprocola]